MSEAHEAQRADPPCAPQAEEDVFTGWERTRGPENTRAPRGRTGTGAPGCHRHHEGGARKHRAVSVPRGHRPALSRQHGKVQVTQRQGARTPKLPSANGHDRVKLLWRLIKVVTQRAPAVTKQEKQTGREPRCGALSHGQEGGRQGPRTSVLGTAPEGGNRSEQGGSRPSRKGSWSRCCAWVTDGTVTVDAA